MALLQLNPPLPLKTPRGNGFAHVVIDGGMKQDLQWVVFLDSGEIWTFSNRDVRAMENATIGRNSSNVLVAMTPERQEQLRSIYGHKINPDE